MTARSILDLPGIRELYSRNLLFPAVVLLAVVVVLLHGAFAPPVHEESAEEATKPLDPPPAFRPDYEKTPLAYTADYWLQVGEQWRPHIILIGSDPTPAIVVAPQLAVSSVETADDLIAEELALSIAAGEARSEPEGESGADRTLDEQSSGPPLPRRDQTPYRLISVNTDHEVAVFALATATPPAPLADLNELQSGAHAAALSLNPDGSLRITPGVVVSAQGATDIPERGRLVGETLDLAISFPEETRVAAIADLDGGLLGVAFETKDGLKIIPAHRVRDIARDANETQPCVSIKTQDLGETMRKLLGVTTGVFVENVREEAFFPEPSIRSGDIILRWAGETVPTREVFEQLYRVQEPGRLVRYLVLRDGRRVSGATRMPDPRCRPVSLGIVPFKNMGLVMKWEGAPTSVGMPAGWRVMSVVAGSSAETAGLQRDDLVVAIQGRTLRPDSPRNALERLERGSQPSVLTVSREGRLKLVTILRGPTSKSGN